MSLSPRWQGGETNPGTADRADPWQIDVIDLRSIRPQLSTRGGLGRLAATLVVDFRRLPAAQPSNVRAKKISLSLSGNTTGGRSREHFNQPAAVTVSNYVLPSVVTRSRCHRPTNCDFVLT